jgi:hypothetical protein
VAAYDPEGGPVSVTAEGLPPGASFEPSTGQFSWIPTSSEAGNYSITFTATDSGTTPMATSAIMTIQVEPSSNKTCQVCYLVFGIALDDGMLGILGFLGFLGLISALVVTIFVGMKDRGESDTVGPSTNHPSWRGPREDGNKRHHKMVEWMEDESS